MPGHGMSKWEGKENGGTSKLARRVTACRTELARLVVSGRIGRTTDCRPGVTGVRSARGQSIGMGMGGCGASVWLEREGIVVRPVSYGIVGLARAGL